MENIDEVVEALGRLLVLPAKVDPQGGYQAILNDKMRFRIEINENIKWVNIIADLGEVPPGAYRLNLFKAALRANGAFGPRAGTMGFAENNRHMLLFDKLYIYDLTEDSLQIALGPFIEKGLIWTDHIAAGSLPDFQPSGGGNPFGV
ncbi:Uncharacterized protein SCG7109_AG_00080 [Chlamydiales bacterium SCGC AG-110-M15]|nr:Uncharacterized protein SCG7109_AG_00080 [Chlamydiales bacterium SCGC AG-110-M15]